MSLQQEHTLRLSYALAKQVPDMAHGFTIETGYGPIQVDAEHTQEIIPAVRKALERQLKALEPRGRATHSTRCKP